MKKARMKWINKIQYSRPCLYMVVGKCFQEKCFENKKKVLVTIWFKRLFDAREKGRERKMRANNLAHIYLSPGKVTESRKQIIFEHCKFRQKSVYRKNKRKCVSVGADILYTFIVDVMTVILNGNGDGVSNESDGVTFKTIAFDLNLLATFYLWFIFF